MSLPVSETIEHGAIAISAVVAAVGAYYAGKRNRREANADRREEAEAKRAEVDELVRIKDEMIEALKADREELKADREDLKRQLAESQKRERELAARVREIEREMREAEKESRRTTARILEAMADSDRCVRARRGCADFEPPGDRRARDRQLDDIKPGGTD